MVAPPVFRLLPSGVSDEEIEELFIESNASGECAVSLLAEPAPWPHPDAGGRNAKDAAAAEPPAARRRCRDGQAQQPSAARLTNTE